MSGVLRTALVGATAVVAFNAVAQDAPKPAEAVPLPPVTVETTKAPTSAKKKKTTASKTSAPKSAAVSPAPVPPSGSEGSGTETGIGPVNGYVATKTTSGTKTDTPLVEIPRSVDVVTADQMEAQQPKSIRHAVGYVPGVQVQSGAGSILDNIAVRGFSAPIYLNGLLLPTDTAIGFSRIRLEPYGLERLEILKGPPSALFGQASPGGIINAVSKRPQFQEHNEVYVQYGTNDHKEAGFDFTGPVSPDAAYRLVGVFRDTDLDFDFADRQRYYIAPSVTFRPTDDTTITFLGSVQRDSGFGPFQFVDLALTKNSAPHGRVSRKTYFGEPSIDDYQEDQWTVGYALEHRFGEGLQFRQNVRYSDSTQDVIAMRAIQYDAVNNKVIRGINALDLQSHGVAVDNQLQADVEWGATKHRILAGLDYQRQSSASGFWVNNPPAFAVPPIDPYDPVYGQPVPDPFASNPFVLADASLEQTGLYLQDQIKLGGWNATLGIRHDWATTKLDNLLGTAPTQVTDDQAWTGFAGLSYLFDNGLAPYISYSTSFLPAFGTSLLNSSTGQALKPTTGEGYEAGIKYQPPGTKTLLTAAAFQITQQNVTSAEQSPTGIVVTQTGEVRVRGVEAEAKTSITDNFDLVAGYSYIEPIITGNITSPFGFSNVQGNDYQQLSRHTGSVWGMYTFHEGPLAGLGFGAGLRYVGTQWAEAANTNKLPAYTLLDAAVSLDLKYLAPGLDGTTLQINGYNLTDEYYVSTCQGATFCQFGESRTILATIKHSW